MRGGDGVPPLLLRHSLACLPSSARCAAPAAAATAAVATELVTPAKVAPGTSDGPAGSRGGAASTASTASLTAAAELPVGDDEDEAGTRRSAAVVALPSLAQLRASAPSTAAALAMAVAPRSADMRPGGSINHASSSSADAVALFVPGPGHESCLRSNNLSTFLWCAIDRSRLFPRLLAFADRK